MSYEIQFSRVTNSGKLPDRFLTCQHHTSDNLTQKGMGEVFTCIEMLSPWFPTAQVGQMVISNFVKYYYQGGSTSDLINFEDSLKKVNEDLAQITQNGETDWIGNLNGAVSVVVGNNLHMATTGQSEAYIFRDGKINHLTEGLSAPVEPHPLKTFTNIVSGELKEQDKILLANKGLFNHISIDALKQIISMNSPSMAAMQIAKLLRKDRVKDSNLIIVGVGLKDEISGLPLEENIGNVFYLDKSSESISKKLSSVTDFFANGIRNIQERAKKKKAAEKIHIPEPLPVSNPKPETREIPEEQDRFHKEFLSEDRDDSLLKDEEIKYSPDLYVHYYKEGLKTSKPNRLVWLNKVLSWLKNILVSFYMWIIASARDRKRRKNLYILGAAVIILIIVLTVLVKGNNNKVSNYEAQQILDQAISTQKEAKSLLSSGDQEESKNKFVSVIDKARQIQDNLFVGSDAKDLIKTSFEELDKLTDTTRFAELEAVATISDSPKAFYVIAGQSYVITGSSIYEVSLVGGNPSKIATLPRNKGEFIAGSRVDKLIYLYTNNQNVFSFDTAAKKLEECTLETGARWETSNSITGFSGSLYLLDGVIGQIYKHASNDTSFGAGTEYVSTVNINLRQSVSMAIDGSIYVLKNNGEVIKIQKSKKQDFSLKNIPSPYETIEKPLKIFTDADTTSLYILDGGQKRILEFSKEGQFIHQYALPDNFSKINDFVVSSKARKVWILNDNSIYEFTI